MPLVHNEKFFFLKIFVILILITSTIRPYDKDDKILAEVGDFKITQNQFIKRYSDYLLSVGVKDKYEIRISILGNMINEILLKNYDDNKKVLTDPEFLKEIEWGKKQVILAFLKDQEVHAKISVTDDEMRVAFARANAKIAVRHLFAETEEEANELYQLLQIGTPFEKLAKQSFTDTTLQNNGGYLGYFSWGDYDPAFEDAAFSLQVGEISKPVKTAYGYSIIKVEDKEINPLLTEDEFVKKKSHLESVLKIRKKKSEEQKYLSMIYNPTLLKLNDRAIQNIYLKLANPQSKAELSNSKTEQVCVEYEGKKYSQVEMENKINGLPYYHRSKIASEMDLKAMIEGIIVQELLFDISVQKGYDKEPLVEEQIEAYSDFTFIKFKTDELTSKYNVNDSSLTQYFNENKESFKLPEEVNVQEIVVNDKKFADSLLILIANGEDFGKLAAQHSMRKWSAENKGILGFSTLDKFGLFKDQIGKAAVGEIVGPLNYQDVYAIFKILDKKTSVVPEMSTIKEQVLFAYKSNNKSRIAQEYISKILDKVEVKISEDVLKNIVIQ
ncbi:MAG: peptidylprolyl isomerase [bacterium]